MWHLIGDGEDMNKTVTVRFDIIWKLFEGPEVVLATTTHEFVRNPPPKQDDAILFETDLPGIGAPAAPGDQLILRFTTLSGAAADAYYIPNGDGSAVNGRTVNITLPK
jgi:hypothetical protein